MNKHSVMLIALLMLLILSVQGAFAKSPNKGRTKNPTEEVVLSNVVKENGRLQVIGGQLCNERGEAIQLKGMSSHGLNFCNFARNTVKYLVRDWNISVIRAAMYPGENGYARYPEHKDRVTAIVEQAIKHGIYVIIDWHTIDERDPNVYREEARAFFEEMATKYGDYPNVIYEICNEPNSSKQKTVTWEGEVKPYAEYIIPAIRAIDPKNIIIVGTETWSQRVDKAADDPLDYSNIMYALHFYAGTHRGELREIAEYALGKGIAIFVTEWGTTNSSGAGLLYLDEAQIWVDWMAKYKISWCNWNFSNHYEDTAALEIGVGMNGPWKDSQLSESGYWVRTKLLEE